MNISKQKELIKRVDFSAELHGSFDHFDAHLIGGNLIILSGPQEHASIRVQWKENEHRSLPKFFIEHNRLKLESKSLKAFIGQKNAYVIEVTLPKETNITIKMFAGVIYLEDVTGNLNVSLKAGEISGYLSGKNIKANIWAGDIKFNFHDLSKDSKINLTCSLGDIILHFPEGTLLNLQSGKTKVAKIENVYNAEITAKTTLGDVSII